MGHLTLLGESEDNRGTNQGGRDIAIRVSHAKNGQLSGGMSGAPMKGKAGGGDGGGGSRWYL